MDTDIAVIGGGGAGIAAARRLHETGRAYVLIEARDRLGGRAWTVMAEGEPVDLGCGWLHSAEGNPWAKVAEAQGRTLDRSPPPWQRPHAGLALTQEEHRAFQRAAGEYFGRISEAARQPHDVAAADLLERDNRWNGLIRSVLSYISGGDAEQVSVRDLENYEDTEVNWRVVPGLGAAIAQHGAGLNVLLEAAVTRVDHSNKRLTIETTRGAISCDKMIVTLPTNVIAENEKLFSPALPDKSEAAAGLPLGLADKLYLALDNADEFTRDTRLFGRIDRITGSYSLRAYGRPQIECYYGASLAAELERGGDETFFACAREDLTRHLGSDFAKRIRPLAVHRWGADLFARGSYSFALPGKAECRQILADPVDGRIFFAGEACSTHDYSTAHGAYRTGVTAAEQALAAKVEPSLRAKRNNPEF
jgi:monoamine oxidase